MTSILENFQSESKKSGDDFENLVESNLLQNGFNITHKGFKIDGIGVNVDFIAVNENRTEYIEAKGGNPGGKKRPGAQRTDNVKKAVANGALLKAINPDAYYVIYFSAKPKKGNSSDEMIQTALRAGYVNEVRYLENVSDVTELSD